MESLSLIQGKFSASEAVDIISSMVQVKIKFHEDKITNTSNEEDIKLQEGRIKELQNDLAELKKSIADKGGAVEIKAVVTVK